jgi:two-component system, NtrC family, sensor histidine kinase HydH
MQWRRLTFSGVLLASWIALAAWQYDEYGHQCESARETLRGEANSVINAVIGGIRSHRGIGYLFDQQIQAFLEELVQSKDVLAVAISANNGQPLISAGNIEALDMKLPMEVGESWETAGFRMVTEFRLAPEMGGPSGGGRGGGRGYGPGGGRGAGYGGGRGRGAGISGNSNAQSLEGADANPPSPFTAGGQYAAILVLDRSQVDEQCRAAAWTRIWVSAAGGLMLLCVALAWRATVRLAEARGRSIVLESETRHLRELGQAAAGLAHETRNPLGLVRGWTQRLAESKLATAEQKQQAQAIIEECDRVASRINQFLAFANPRHPNFEPVELGRMVKELAVLLEPDLDAKNLHLDYPTLTVEETVLADRELLRQALFNLLQNAVQMSPEGTKINIGLHPGANGRKRIEVADRGPGVPADVAPSLFTPYFTTRAGGTGLGLALIRRIAAVHGWQAGFTPRPAGGSIFWLDGIHE